MVTNLPAAYGDSLSLIDVVHVLIRRWRLIVGTTFASGLLIYSYALLTLYLPASSPWNLLPNIYRAQATLLFVERNSSRLASLSRALTVRSGDELTVIGSSNDGAVAQELLKGRTLYDQLISDFDFASRYGIVDPMHTNARKLIAKSLHFDYDSKSRVMSIGFEGSDAKYAAAVLERVIEVLEQRFRSLTLEALRLKKQHLGQLLAEAKKSRRAAQESMVALQGEHGMLTVQEQSRQTARFVSEYTRELLAKEVKMKSLISYSHPDDPSVVQLRSEIRVIRRLLDEFRSGYSDFSKQAITQEELPGMVARHLSLRRDFEISDENYTRLRLQYELAQFEETDPWPTIQVIEAAEAPEIRSWPSRSRICIMATVSAFLLSLLVAFFVEYVSRIRANPSEAAKLTAIGAQFRGRAGSCSGD